MLAAKTDAQLCKAAAAGQHAAFTELVKRYQGAVCAVTFATVGRREESEDVAQETFLVAWRKLGGIEQPDRVAGWLTGIARNLARKRLRRRDPMPLDSAGDVHDEGPDLEHAAMETQVRARLWERLSQVKPKYREILVLYYREQLTTPQLAAQLGISVSAAEQRLSRGRRMLREQLDADLREELGGTRPGEAFTRRVAAALPALPVVAPAPATPPSPTVSSASWLSSLTKAIVMYKPISVAVTVLAAVVAFTVYSRSQPSTANSNDSASPVKQAGVQPGPASATSSPWNPLEDSLVSGLIVDAQSGQAIEGAVITFVAPDGALATIRARGESSKLALGRSDDEGRWTIRGLAAGSYRATASAPGYLPGRAPRLRVGGGKEVEDVRIELSAGGLPLAGVVSDIGGGPVEGATVRATGDRGLPIAALTDEDGHYHMQLPPGPHELRVWDTQYEEDSKRVDIRGRGSRADFELIPAATLSGQVVERATGTPVANAIVSFTKREVFGQSFSFTSASADERVVTGPDGRFSLQRLSPAEYQLIASADHRASTAPVEVAVGLADDHEGIIVPVDPAFNISGRVVPAEDADKGIANATIQTFASDLHYDVVADADGNFELLGVLPGKYLLRVEAEQRLPSLTEATVEITDADVRGVEVSLDPGHTIRGRLDPPQRAEVKLDTKDKGGGFSFMVKHQSIASAKGQANDEGYFTLNGAPTGDWIIVAEGGDGSRGEVPVSIGSEDLSEVVIAMSPRSTLRGAVFDQQGDPVAEARVHLFDGGVDIHAFGVQRESTTTDQAGTFEFVGTDPGAHLLSVVNRESFPLLAANGQETHSVEIRASVVNNVRLEVQRATGVLAGVVADADGHPLVDAAVKLFANAKGAKFSETPLVMTDSDGRFEFDELPEGLYTLNVRGNHGEAQGKLDDISVGDGLTRVEVRTTAMASITGQVSAGGQPVTHFVVSIDGRAERTFLKEEGRFELRRLDPSRPAIVTITSDVGSDTQRIDLVPGQIAEASFELGGWATIEGRAIWPDGSPAAGMKVSVHSRGGKKRQAQTVVDRLSGADGVVTGDDGRFSVGGVGAGRGAVSIIQHVDVAASPRALVSQVDRRGHLNFYVEAGETAELGDIELVAPGTNTTDTPGTLGLYLKAAYDRPAGRSEPGYAPPIGRPEHAAALWVQSVTNKGPAANAGLTAGMQIVSINGRPVFNVGKAFIELNDVSAGKTYSLEVRAADGQVRTVALTAAKH